MEGTTMLRRYRIYLIDQGQELLAGRPHIESLDLDTATGLAHANSLLAVRFVEMCQAAGLGPRHMHRCYLRVEDEATGQVVHTVYAPADTL
jgi:hypothetical protein